MVNLKFFFHYTCESSIIQLVTFHRLALSISLAIVQHPGNLLVSVGYYVWGICVGSRTCHVVPNSLCIVTRIHQCMFIVAV